MTAAAVRALDSRLAAAAGIVSIWYGAVDGPPAFARRADTEHYAASTIKLGLLVAAYRLYDAARLDLDSTVVLHDDFSSVCGPRFRLTRGHDNDDEPWERLGEAATLRWLARRMIVRSSNLAADLLLERVGLPAVAEALGACGAGRSAFAPADRRRRGGGGRRVQRGHGG